VTEDNEQRTTRKWARQRMAIEALILFLFAWLTTMVISLLRPSPSAASECFVLFHFIGSTFVAGLECFVFGYVLSRFFKQFKTGCAFAIILFFAYLLWAGRHR
jgi:Na+/citrate or Na+/malate symporter